MTRESDPELVPSADHCIELNTGKAFSGNVKIGTDEIRVDLHGYGTVPGLEDQSAIFLKTERNRVISLHSVVTSGGGQHGLESPVHHERIYANIAVEGYAKWEEKDPVKRVAFRLKNAEQLLMHKDKDETLASRLTSGSDGDLFRQQVEGITVSARYSGVWHGGRKEPTEAWTELEIEFSEEATVFNYIESVMTVVRFFSFCLGTALKPSQIRIYKQKMAERLQALENKQEAEEFEVHYVWPEPPVEDLDTWVGGSPVRAWDDEQVADLCKCLEAWMARSAAWKNSSILMMGALSSKREMSVDRLMQACKWFEEIPLTKLQQSIQEKHLGEIAAVAVAKATELGYGPIEPRIQGALRSIKTERNEDRFNRLVEAVRARFGAKVLNDSVTADLMKAIALRGKGAHGHLDASSEHEFKEFGRAVYAMEALAWLLTALELPMNTEGVEAVNSNPLVRDYRHGASS